MSFYLDTGTSSRCMFTWYNILTEIIIPQPHAVLIWALTAPSLWNRTNVVPGCVFPANTRRWTNGGLNLGHNVSCLLGLCFRTCLQDNNIMVAAKLWDDNSKNLLANSHQSKARRWPYAGSMLVHRLRHNTHKWLDVLCQLGCRMTVSLCTM